MTDVTTIADVEAFQWLLERFDSRRPPSLKGTSLSLAAAGELLFVMRKHYARDIRESLNLQFESCPIWRSMYRFLLSAETTRDPETALVFASIPVTYNDEWIVTEMREFQSSLEARGFSRALSASLAGGVFEIVDNVWRHSQAISPSVLAYQIRNRAFSFFIADSGVGVLASLNSNRQYSHIRTSVEALQIAVRPSVSRLPDGSGLGFDTLMRSLANFWGRTRLRSGQGVLSFNRETEEHSQSHYFLPHLAGLQVSGVCRLVAPKKSS